MRFGMESSTVWSRRDEYGRLMAGRLMLNRRQRKGRITGSSTPSGQQDTHNSGSSRDGRSEGRSAYHDGLPRRAVAIASSASPSAIDSEPRSPDSHTTCSQATHFPSTPPTCDWYPYHTRLSDTTPLAMGALLSLPLLAIPSVGSVSCPFITASRHLHV